MSAAAKVSGSNAPSSMSLYSPVGSSSGKKGAIAGTYAVGASDVPMGTVVNGTNLDSSLLTNADPAHTLNSYVQVPVVLGGVGMMYNLPSLTKKFGKFPVVLSSAVLAGVYDGAITKWNNPAICQLNPKIVNVKRNKKHKVIRSTCALPNLAIVPCLPRGRFGHDVHLHGLPQPNPGRQLQESHDERRGLPEHDVQPG